MPSILSFSDQVVLVLGTSNVISKSYAWFFESRGAKVVLGDVRGCGGNTKVKDTKHHRIVAKSPAQLAVSAVEHTVKAHGRLDVLLISSIAASSSKSDGTDDSAWNILIDGHLQSAFKSVRAAWPYFRKQRFGRILFTADTHGGSDQFLDSATNFALLGLAKTIGIEGLKHNVLCNVIAPLQGDFLPDVDPDMVLTIAAVLVHSANSAETGSLFAVDGKRVSRMRWQRSAGAVLKPTPTMTAGTVLSRWHHYVDFSRAVWPSQGIDFDLILQTAIRMEDNELVKSPDFSGKVVIVTGAGAGLGRSYANAFAKLGASIVVNDITSPDDTLQEIIMNHGKAASHVGSAEDGQGIVQRAVESFGRIDILINNAGIVRDKSLLKMDDKSWEQVLAVHLRGTYNVIRAAWPHMVNQGFGRIINTTSTSGIYGNFGQANYAAAKAGIIGLSQSFARAGASHNVLVNTVAPAAGTNMSRSVMTEDMVQAMKPEWNAPFVVALCSDSISPPPTGLIFELGLGWMANTRLQRSTSFDFSEDQGLTPERVLDAWPQLLESSRNREGEGRSKL